MTLLRLSSWLPRWQTSSGGTGVVTSRDVVMGDNRTTTTSTTTTTTGRGDTAWYSIAAGFAMGSMATTLVVVGYYSYFRRQRPPQQQQEEEEQPRPILCPSSNQNHNNSSGKSKNRPFAQGRILPNEIRQEQLSRHALFFGNIGIQLLQEAQVCVIGLGGVGSHTATMLARGGIGYLRIIDFDQVTLSSLNRHACATLQHVGISKATCLAQHLYEICPDPLHLYVDARVAMFTKDTSWDLLAHTQPWTVVIDAIDDTTTKAYLLAYCLHHHIKVYSCMGAGGKADFTRLHCSDLRTASRDPLATKLRQELKKVFVLNPQLDFHKQPKQQHEQPRNQPSDECSYLDDMDRLTIIYSSEKPVAKLAGMTAEQEQEGIHRFGAVDGMRIRVLPVLGTMPAIMGQGLATLALTYIGRMPFSPVTGERVGRTVRNKLWQQFQHRERVYTRRVVEEQHRRESLEDEKSSADGVVLGQDEELKQQQLLLHGFRVQDGRWVGPAQIDPDDVEYLLEVWRNRCSVTGARLGTTLHLVRWDMTKPSTCDNIVVVCAHALQKFEQQPGGILRKEQIPAHVVEAIEARLASTKSDSYGGNVGYAYTDLTHL